jgi:hypothetical protein
MKKIMMLVMALVISVSSSNADTIERLWNSLLTPAPGMGGEVNGTGAGWWVTVWNMTDGVASGGGNTVSTFGWITGYGYAINDFTFGSATESDSVALRLYNNANPLSATMYIDSITTILPDLDDLVPPGPTDLNVTFNFSGQSWQAVPEPATALLFGIGGMGAWMVRRSKLKSKEEADA